MSNEPAGQARIDLRALAGPARYDRIAELEEDPACVTHTTLRGTELVFHTTTRRQLWQALGHEFIEPELLDFIDTLDGNSVFYDIGASNGIFSIYAAHKGLKVYSFEPEAQNFALLEHNAFLNHQRLAHPCHCFNVALADENGMGRLFIARYEAGGHMKILDEPVKVQESGEFEPEYVQTTLKFRLDDLIRFAGLPPPCALKIDVDGAEAAVIGGALQTLAEPTLENIFIELEDGSEKARLVLAALEQAGFVIEKSCQVQHYNGLSNHILVRSPKPAESPR